MIRQFDWQVPDWIVIPVGNLGNISALYKGLKLLMDLGMIDKMPRLVAAQASKANPFYLSYRQGFSEKAVIQAQETLATAIQIGNPVSYAKAVQAIQETNGLVEQVTEHELANVAAMADLTGMYTCPHTGVALAATLKLIERGEISLVGPCRGHQHGQWPQVHRFQSRLSRGQPARSRVRIRQSADLSAGQCQGRQGYDRPSSWVCSRRILPQMDTDGLRFSQMIL